MPGERHEIDPCRGKLGVLLSGMGAVSSTLVAGVLLHRKGLGDLVGSLSQMQNLELDDDGGPRLRDLAPLERVDNLVFGGWDVIPDDMYDAARKAGVLPAERLAPIESELRRVAPFPGVFDEAYVKNLDASFVKRGRTRREQAELLIDDIRTFTRENRLDRCVVIWCGSTEALPRPSDAHRSVAGFERALDDDDPDIPPSMLYGYAALRMGLPFANGAPNLAVDTHAMVELAEANGSPIAGKDLKTGQTWLKTVIAPAIRARMLGLTGWYSMNLLGNRDGRVLEDPGSRRAKESTKRSALDRILDARLYPDLYGGLEHQVHIDYYPPRGDAKESWDNIDFFGWLGLPMQIKMNLLGRDSILAAPMVLDLALFLDLAKRAGLSGVQDWLSFYFKEPQARAGSRPEHDSAAQHRALQTVLRRLLA